MAIIRTRSTLQRDSEATAEIRMVDRIARTKDDEGWIGRDGKIPVGHKAHKKQQPPACVADVTMTMGQTAGDSQATRRLITAE